MTLVATSLVEFMSLIDERTVEREYISTYRGHSNKRYKLVPSVFRNSATFESEDLILRELISAHPDDFSSDQTTLEMLVRMQHYSLPTRLLDVSMNPLVALYFAAQTKKIRVYTKDRSGNRTSRTVEADGEVITLTVSKRDIKYFDSDTVSCIANLSRLRSDLKYEINTKLSKISFNRSTSIKRLVHFICQERPGFRGEIDPLDLDKVILTKPKQNNKRIIAQAGLFFSFGMTQEIDKDLTSYISIDRIKIPSDRKELIRAQLDKFNINEKSLFPEIERAANYITANIPKPDLWTDLFG